MSTGIAMPSSKRGAIVWQAAPAHDLRRAMGIFEVARRVYQINGSDRRVRDVKLSLCAWMMEWTGHSAVLAEGMR
jgi:hypothetical protein